VELLVLEEQGAKVEQEGVEVGDRLEDAGVGAIQEPYLHPYACPYALALLVVQE